MSNEQATAGAVEPMGIMDWLLAMLQLVNADSKLAPPKATQKRAKELIDAYGPDSVWQMIKAWALTFNISNPSVAEELFQKRPDLPHVIKTDEACQAALGQWFAQNRGLVALVHKISSTVLKAKPVVEWETGESTDVGEGFGPITELLFQNREET